VTSLSYEIVRSSRRLTIAIEVTRDALVRVHVPAMIRDEVIRATVATKTPWILEKLKHPQKYQPLPHPPGKEAVNGEAALFLGREYPIAVTNTASGKVEFEDRFFVPVARTADRRRVLREWYVARAADLIKKRATARARALGVVFKGVRIVDSRHRWGSCSAAGLLSFNWRLVKAPLFVMDYVIVHELAHLLELGHGKRFWGIVRAHLPAADRATHWLKENGQLLEEEI
jgi:predicted metal-dependent hydrolase